MLKTKLNPFIVLLKRHRVCRLSSYPARRDDKDNASDSDRCVTTRTTGLRNPLQWARLATELAAELVLTSVSTKQMNQYLQEELSRAQTLTGEASCDLLRSDEVGQDFDPLKKWFDFLHSRAEPSHR